jgi:hypothetical protein
MNLVCPCCQAVFPLDSALEDIAHREAYTELLALTPFPELLPGYLRLFSPPKRALSGAKKARLTAELVKMIKEARFDCKRISYVAPLEYWRTGFETLQSKRDAGSLDLPLQSHNLLLTVMANHINKAGQRQEAMKEDRLAGRTKNAEPAAYQQNTAVLSDTKPRTQMPDSVKSILKGMKSDPNTAD